jgi:gas vesicle protein
MKTGKTLLGILAGVAAGTIIGILLAPDKGSETRKKILDKGEDYAEKLKQKFNDFIDDIQLKKDTSTENETNQSESNKA